MFFPRQDFNDCRAVFDVRGVIDKLKLKAVAKSREFLLQRIFQFRRPMTNYQMTQNQLLNYRSALSLFLSLSLPLSPSLSLSLLLSLPLSLSHFLLPPALPHCFGPPFSYFNEFLMAHSRDLAEQLRSEYIDTMSKVPLPPSTLPPHTLTHTHTHTHTHTLSHTHARTHIHVCI